MQTNLPVRGSNSIVAFFGGNKAPLGEHLSIYIDCRPYTYGGCMAKSFSLVQ